MIDKVIEGLRAAGYNVLVETIELHPRLLVIAKCGASVFLIVKHKGAPLWAHEHAFNKTYTGLCYIVFSLEDALDKLEAIDARHC